MRKTPKNPDCSVEVDGILCHGDLVCALCDEISADRAFDAGFERYREDVYLPAKQARL